MDRAPVYEAGSLCVQVVPGAPFRCSTILVVHAVVTRGYVRSNRTTEAIPVCPSPVKGPRCKRGAQRASEVRIFPPGPFIFITSPSRGDERDSNTLEVGSIPTGLANGTVAER
jgi:hypothetical protein